MEKISVIIPTYNRLDILKLTLQEYNKQTLLPEQYQIIVVDDGSDDGTFEFLKKNQNNYSFELKIFRQKNMGANSAREKGITEADYPFVLITGDDMIPEKNFLEEHLKFHKKYPDENHAILGFIDWHPDIPLDSFKKYITLEGGEQFLFNVLKDNDEATYHFFYTSNISLKKSFLNKFDYIFDKDFTYPAYDDIELGVRLWEKGLKIIHNKNAIVYHYHNITLESFERRSYNSGKMAWIFYKKQISEINIKFSISNFITHYEICNNKKFQQFIKDATYEINKISPEYFDKFFISEENENIGKNIRKYQSYFFKNFLRLKLALGLYEAINEECPFNENLNLLVLPDGNEENRISLNRIISPSEFLKILNGINIYQYNQIDNLGLEKIDIIIVQNSEFFKYLKLINEAKIKDKKIILDIDNLIWDFQENFIKNKELIKELIDLITVPTEKLKKEVEKFYEIKGYVIPDFVNINYFYYSLKRERKRNLGYIKKKLKIGVLGDNFQIIEPVIEKIIKKYPHLIIKFFKSIPENLKKFRNVHEILNMNNYLEYAKRLRNEDFDIILIPLLENRFNFVKSNIEWLEVSITKIPSIISDLSQFENIENFKTGIKVKNNEKEWFDAICLLIENESLRNEVRENCFKEALNNWTLQKNFCKFLEPIKILKRG